MTEAVQNSLWTTEHVLFLEVVFKFYLFKFQVLSESSKETWEARSSLWAVDVVFCPFLPKRANKCQRKGPNKRRPKAAASLQFPIRVLWLNFGPPVSCCGVNCILGILKRTARPKIEPPKTSVAYHSRGMCKLTYQYDMEALYLVFWICLFFFARSFIRVNSRVLIQLKKYHWTNHSCARTHTHLSRSRSLSLPWLGRRLLPSQGKTTTTICPEPICGPGTSGPNHRKDGNSRVYAPRTLTTCTQSNIHSKPTIILVARRGLLIDLPPVRIFVTCTSAWHARNAPFHPCESRSSPRVFGAAYCRNLWRSDGYIQAGVQVGCAAWITWTKFKRCQFHL